MFHINENGERVWEGRIVRDADKPLPLILAEIDTVGSVSRDPLNCVVAKCAVRHPDILEARIGARACYICFRKEPGVWYRYWLRDYQAAQILQFDEVPTGVRAISKWINGQSITLNPPSASNALGASKAKPVGKRNNGPRKRQMVRASLRNVLIAPRAS